MPTFPPRELEILREDGLREIAARGQIRSFQKNVAIIQEGDAGDSLYIILTGKVKVYARDEEGKEVVIDTCGPGEFVGEMALDGEPRSASVMTLEPSAFAVIRLADLRQHIAEHPDFAIHLIKTLIKRTRKTTSNVKTLALMDVYGRVARLLLDLAVEENGKWIVSERLNQREIAERVGSSREMVSRIIKDLAIGGYIEVQRRTITIIRPPPRHW